MPRCPAPRRGNNSAAPCRRPGVSKPDRHIFEIALERSCCKPENAVMIGDRIDNDIVPAKQLGMKTIWVKQGLGSLWNITDESEKADMEINNLSDVLKYL